MNVAMMDNAMPGAVSSAAGDSSSAFWDPGTNTYRPEQLQGYGDVAPPETDRHPLLVAGLLLGLFLLTRKGG